MGSGLIELGLSSWRPTPAVERRTLTLADFPWLAELLSPPNTAGVVVTERTALNCSAYWNGVDVISGQVAALPRLVYRRTDGDGRERATDQPAWKLLHEQPNPYATPFVFWQTLMGHALTWGNGYAEIERDSALRPIGLLTLLPCDIEVRAGTVVLGGQPYSGPYYVWKGTVAFHPDDVIHVPGLGFDGLKGYSVVNMARRSLALGLAAERFGGAFFGNGAWPGLMLEHPARLSDEGSARLRAQVEARHAGPDRAHKTMVLEEGMKANKIGIPPEDAQFLQTREFQVVEVARWLNLPPHKLKHKYGERPGGNLEAGQIEFLTDTLRPWLVRIEQECGRKLIAPALRGTYYVEHLVDDLLRMDGESRARSYRAYFDMGVLNAEQIAEKENLPKPQPKEPPPVPAPAPADEQVASAQRALLLDTVARFIRRQAEKAKRASRQGPEHLAAWLEASCEEDEPVLRSMLVPPLRLICALRAAGDADATAGEIARTHFSQVREELLALPARGLADQVERVVTQWETIRAVELTERALALVA